MASVEPSQNAGLRTNATISARARQRWHKALAAYKKLSASQSTNGNDNDENVVLRKDPQRINLSPLDNSSTGDNVRRLSPHKLLHDVNHGETHLFG